MGDEAGVRKYLLTLSYEQLLDFLEDEEINDFDQEVAEEIKNLRESLTWVNDPKDETKRIKNNSSFKISESVRTEITTKVTKIV